MCLKKINPIHLGNSAKKEGLSLSSMFLLISIIIILLVSFKYNFLSNLYFYTTLIYTDFYQYQIYFRLNIIYVFVFYVCIR